MLDVFDIFPCRYHWKAKDVRNGGGSFSKTKQLKRVQQESISRKEVSRKEFFYTKIQQLNVVVISGIVIECHGTSLPAKSKSSKSFRTRETYKRDYQAVSWRGTPYGEYLAFNHHLSTSCIN